MAQGYYTLQEAAQFLAISVEEMKQLAQKGKIRSFQDRGTLRFRVQDIQELARARGGASDPDQVLGDASLPPKSGSTPPSSARKKGPGSPKSPGKKQGAPEVFDFAVDGENVDVGADLVVPSGNPKSKPPGSKSKKVPTPQPTTAGSDSDVRLVADGSDVSFSIPKDSDPKKHPDSDVRISPDPLKPKTGIHTPPPGSGAKKRGLPGAKKSESPSDATQSTPKPGSPPSPVDSGVRLVPMDSDSDVKLHGSDEVPLGEGAPTAASDSNVRLEKASALPGADWQEGGMMLTEEINLDEEILKQQEAEQDKPLTKVKAKSELKLPTTSPFELSDSDLELPSELKEGGGPKTPVKVEGKDSSDFELTAAGAQQEGSSDFDLVPSEDGGVLLEGDSGDFSLEASDDSEEVLLEERTELTSSSSGISLDNPVDAGISLEEGGDASDFDLSLEVEDTPSPRKSEPAGDVESSEFELSVDSDADVSVPQSAGDSSEFELNLEGSGESELSTSDSEFELTLDDSGDLQAVDEEKPQVKSKKKKAAPSTNEQDIFDTDFEVPNLEEGGEAAVADSELESSDFDLALDDSELAQEEESGSQVVALDEEEAVETVADDAAVVDDVEVDEESSDFADLDADVEVETEEAGDDAEGEEETETAPRGKKEIVIQEKLIPASPWGVMPVIFMLPCVVIMFLVGILGYELVQTSAGLRPPGPLTVALADLLERPVSMTKTK